MNIKAVVNILGILIAFVGAIMIVPMGLSIYYAQGDTLAFLYSALFSIFFGGILMYIFKGETRFGVRESFGIVSFGWISMTLVGALPLYLYGFFENAHVSLSFTDAFFETMSGFSTTGATIFTDIEKVPKALLFWRSLTQWLGGMGIIVLSVAILPLLGIGGVQLFKAESPGPSADKLKPRIAETAKVLWKFYAGLTLLEVILLMFGGMSAYDATCHTLSTLATGGFSPKNASVAHYDSVYVEGVITFFMFLAGANFALYYYVLKGKIHKVLSNKEFQVYVGIIAFSAFAIALNIYLQNNYTLFKAFRSSIFQVVSIVTTTGFGTDNFDLWPSFSKSILFFLMFIGGCGGSTGGGMKVIRVMILFKFAHSLMKKIIHPRGVFRVRIAGQTLNDELVNTVAGFFILFVITYILSVFYLTINGIDLITSLSTCASCIGNVGPGLAKTGPIENYAWMPSSVKWVLTLLMLLGRLEIYTVLMLFLPMTWKK